MRISFVAHLIVTPGTRAPSGRKEKPEPCKRAVVRKRYLRRESGAQR
jgi:hypothetical protein